MKSILSTRGLFVLGVCLASLLVGAGRASAQGQGRYITEAADRIHKLVDKANKEGYSLHNNKFSIGGGWLKQSKKEWVPLYSIELQAGKKYRFLAAGDKDAKDVDLEILNEAKKVVAKDADADPFAVVDFTPKETGRYYIRVRLYASDNDEPCVCLSVMMTKK